VNRLAKLALALLFFSGGIAKAQVITPLQPPPAIQHFVISVSAAGYNGMKGEQPVTIMGAALQLTPNVSVGYNQIFNPADSTQPYYRLAVANYTRELGDVCPFCKTHFVFDTTSILLTVQGGLGKVSITPPGLPGVSHIAETIGGFVNYPLADHVSFQVIGYQLLHGQGTTTLTRNMTQQVSSGLYFTF
jgi:hypothetical protein